MYILGVIGGWEIIVILLVVLLLFGGKKIPELMKGLGKGVREYKKAANEVEEEIHSIVNEDKTTEEKKSNPTDSDKM